MFNNLIVNRTVRSNYPAPILYVLSIVGVLRSPKIGKSAAGFFQGRREDGSWRVAAKDYDARVWGLPLFPLALFVIWGGLIAVLAWVVEHHSNVSPLD